jgi:hypothetical protein
VQVGIDGSGTSAVLGISCLNDGNQQRQTFLKTARCAPKS